jgi:hypothetical protein
LTVLFSSLAVGISIGMIITLLILVPNPVVTIGTVLKVAAYLVVTLLGLLFLSLYPGVRLARTSILKIIT